MLYDVAVENTFPLLLVAIIVGGLALLSPGLLVADSWMTLVAGREIVANGIPDSESLIALAAGDRWIDQQWLAQLAWYGVHQAGGLVGVALVDAVLVAVTYGSAMAAARLLGAGQRAAFLVATVCLFVAPWSWQVRAQAFALPLFVWVLWLAADHVRRPSRRLLVAIPLLLLWANLHGSVLLGAGITALAALWALPRARSRAEVALGVGVTVAAPLCILATPYGLDIVDYYRLLILDPPFGHEIVEWQRATPGGVTALFYGVAVASAVLVAWKRRRLTWFEIVILVLLFAQAVQAVRGITWFTLAVAVLVPNAVEGAIRRPDVVRHRRVNALFAGLALVAALVMVAAAAAKPPSWFERFWPTDALAAIAATPAQARVFPSDRHADWLLWHQPDLRGRLAYDVRFELLSPATFQALLRWTQERGANWQSIANGYDVVVVDESSSPSHTAPILREDGARRLFSDDDITVLLKPHQQP